MVVKKKFWPKFFFSKNFFTNKNFFGSKNFTKKNFFLKKIFSKNFSFQVQKKICPYFAKIWFCESNIYSFCSEDHGLLVKKIKLEAI